MSDDRAAMTAASINDLPDSAFAYIESGGTKDASGRTTPRSLRHFPIHDAAHVRNALARAPQSPFGKQAMPKIMAAAKKFGIEVGGMNSTEQTGLSERSVPFEVEPSSDGLNLEGYAAVYNSPTRIDSWEGRFDEVILPGAFARALSRRTPVLMFEHGKHPLIGSMPLGVITRHSEDSKGLYIQARLSDNWLIQPVRDAVRDRAVNGMSFRFQVNGGDDWQRRANDVELRSIREFEEVPELGPVVFPAYEPTTATVRSLVQQLPDLGAIRADMPAMPGTESGDDPVMLARAACAALDAAMAACGPDPMSPELARACALMTAADASLDALLEALGATDLPDPAYPGGRSTDFTGRPAQGAGGGDPGTRPGNGGAPAMSIRQRLDDGALRARKVLQ